MVVDKTGVQSGYVNEEVEIRKYAPYCIAELERYGHTCVNCTPSGNITLIQSLSYRTTHANGAKYGNAVLKQIVALGFKNRGIKYPSLYVTNLTNMTAFL